MLWGKLSLLMSFYSNRIHYTNTYGRFAIISRPESTATITLSSVPQNISVFFCYPTNTGRQSSCLERSVPAGHGRSFANPELTENSVFGSIQVISGSPKPSTRLTNPWRHGPWLPIGTLFNSPFPLLSCYNYNGSTTKKKGGGKREK